MAERIEGADNSPLVVALSEFLNLVDSGNLSKKRFD